MKGNLSGKLKRSLAGVITGVMAVAMVIPAGVTTFAADENVKCVITYADPAYATTETTSITAALEIVKPGGTTITVTGKVDSNITIRTDYDYVIDLSGATVAESVVANLNTQAESECLWENNGVWTYTAQKHKWEATAEGTATATPTIADVVFYCGNGHTEKGQVSVAENYVPAEEDGYLVYTATDTDKNVTVTWKVKKEEVTHYAIDSESLSYRQFGDGFAVLENGVPSFFSYLKNNEAFVLDDNGNKVVLEGTIVGEATKTKVATATEYGEHSYKVAFTFPDGKKATSTVGGETVEYVVISRVKDIAKTTLANSVIDGIEFLYKTAAGKDKWVFTDLTNGTTEEGITLGAKTDTEDELVIADDGSLTYRFIYNTSDTENNGKSGEKGESKALKVNKKSETYDCGTKAYKYDAIAETYTGNDGNIATSNVKVTLDPIEGEHAYADRATWAKSFKANADSPASHSATGKATAECKFCDKEWKSDSYEIPKTADHEFKKENGAEVVKTVDATCQHPGFQYKICVTPDGGWKNDSTYELKLSKTESYTFGAADKDTFKIADNSYGHPVLVEGSVTQKVGHQFFVQSASWEEDAELAAKETKDDVICTVTKKCGTCPSQDGADTYRFVYHKWTADEKKADEKKVGRDFELDEGSTDTVTSGNGKQFDIYGAITFASEAGIDCTKADKITYTLNGESYSSGGAITKTIESTNYFGAHDYKNTVLFSEDGKTATVMQQCTKACGIHKDAAGNQHTQTKKADVTPTENADGSTTYTASVEGIELTNNTKTVFDLSKATVTVNEGADVDLNQYALSAADGKKALADVVVVAINGATIDKSLYTIAVTAPSENALSEGNNTLKISPIARPTLNGEAVNVNGEAKAVVKCVRPATFDTLGGAYITFDGNKKRETAKYDADIYFDGNAHPVVATPTSNSKVVDATVKYAVVEGACISDTTDASGAITASTWQSYDNATRTWKDIDPSKLSYDQDTVNLLNANTYAVYVQFSKDGYTSAIYPVDFYQIDPQNIAGAVVTLGKQSITYGEQLTATTGNADTDKKIGLTVADTTKLGVGKYNVYNYVTYDHNYDIGTDFAANNEFEVEKRNATIVMTEGSKAYDGEAIDPTTLFTVDGAINGDTLDVVVNTVGNKELKAAGTYTLVATANDSNYSIEKYTATYTITKAANTLKVAKASRTAKVKNLKKKAVTVAGVKVSNKGTGTLSYKIAKVNKNKANFKINAKNGKITVKKGTKKGTYKVTVSVTAKGNANVNKKTAKAVVTIKVK